MTTVVHHKKDRYDVYMKNNDNMCGIIYKVTNKSNGKFYIGKTTKGLNRRRTEHLSFIEPKTIFQKAIKKYGKDSFEWEVILECKTSEDLIYSEKEMIRLYVSNNNNFGYNMTEGGDGFAHGEKNPVHRPEIKQKIINKLKLNNGSFRQEVRDKISKTLKGRLLSEEHKKAISKGSMGHRASKGKNNPKSKEWIVEHPNGYLEKIKGLREFCEKNSLNRKLMRRTSRGELHNHKGFKLILINE